MPTTQIFQEQLTAFTQLVRIDYSLFSASGIFSFRHHFKRSSGCASYARVASFSLFIDHSIEQINRLKWQLYFTMQVGSLVHIIGVLIQLLDKRVIVIRSKGTRHTRTLAIAE